MAIIGPMAFIFTQQSRLGGSLYGFGPLPAEFYSLRTSCALAVIAGLKLPSALYLRDGGLVQVGLITAVAHLRGGDFALRIEG